MPEKNFQKEFGEKLKKRRNELGLTASKVAALAKVGHRSVTRWENGLGMPSGSSLQKLSEIYGVIMTWTFK